MMLFGCLVIALLVALVIRGPRQPPGEKPTAKVRVVLNEPPGLSEKELQKHRKTLHYLLGTTELFDPPVSERPQLNPVVVGEIRADGYVIRKLYYESLPGFFVPVNLYIPEDPVAFPFPRPAVICPHGHWEDNDGKASKQVQIRSISLALQGYVVLAFDGIGSGDRWSTAVKPGHEWLSAATSNVGGPLSMGLQVYEISRAIDYLMSLIGIVDVKKVALTGASGGASQSIYAAALDPRIDVVVAVSFGSIGRKHERGCGCEHIPLFGRYMEVETLLALMVPTKVLAMDGKHPSQPTLAPLTYSRRGVADRFRFDTFSYSHGYCSLCRQKMAAWLSRWLLEKDVQDALPDPAGVSDDMELRSPELLRVDLPKVSTGYLEVGANLRRGLPGIDLPTSDAQWHIQWSKFRRELEQ